MRLGIIDGSTVKTVGEHTALFPNTSFPRTGIPASFLTENNAKEVKIPTYDTKTQKLNKIAPVIDGDYIREYEIKKVKIPTYDTKTQKLSSITPVIDGDYVKEYEVVSLTTEEKTTVDNQQWDTVRKDRNVRLEVCDWTQITDSPLTDEKKTEWQTYRTALRDITKQSNPFNITWPTEPS